jgi:regulator of sirC expression with transglutaminase-like and TPR domain
MVNTTFQERTSSNAERFFRSIAIPHQIDKIKCTGSCFFLLDSISTPTPKNNRNMQAIKTELLELLRRNDLLRASLLVGRVQDAVFNDEPFVHELMSLAARVWHRSAKTKHDPVLKAEQINHVLFEEAGIQGKSEKYKQVIDDPHRYYLHSVMQKKVGSPLAVTILYLILAEQVGLEFECMALPSYYLIKVKDFAGDFYIDPFDKGKFLTQEEFQKKFRTALQRNRMIQTNLFEQVSATQLVARLVQQLKHIYILKGSAVEALRAVELLTGIYPDSPELTRDRGILYCEMEYFSRAISDLKYYLDQRPNAEDFKEIKKLTSMLKGYREVVN